MNENNIYQKEEGRRKKEEGRRKNLTKRKENILDVKHQAFLQNSAQTARGTVSVAPT
ncbi:hypothetical protein [Okeania sp. KiyG1]|uniref:hypothetical protein n=1 Tax=Okeania sp. KiyG1 TaxID=2720165 RepID=UPI00192223A2|nr:hypothetical protein [Okeania sp. KiyG1]